MIKLAVVTFTLDRLLVATLTDAGWECHEAPVIARLLDLGSPLSKFGPGDGDPVTCAARSAAQLLDGKVDFIRAIPDDPPGTVY
jgi:hypothetical protein